MSKTPVDPNAKYEVTEFGRRRVSKVPKLLLAVCRIVTWPFVFVYRKFKPAPAAASLPATPPK